MLSSRHGDEVRDPSCEHPQHRNPFIPPNGNSCPINNLPTELLSRIFQSGITTPQDPVATDDQAAEVGGESGDVCEDIERSDRFSRTDRDARLPPPFQVLVSHVCQHWRNVAISTTSLWTSITVSSTSQLPYPYVVASLERSKQLPIDILVHSRPQEHVTLPPVTFPPYSTPSVVRDIEALYSLLIAHMHRWRSIEVRNVSIQHMFTFLAVASCPEVTGAPQLTSLILSTDRPMTMLDHSYVGLSDYFFIAEPASAILFGGSAPRLEHVSLAGLYIDWGLDWISHAYRLTTLELRGHSSDGRPSWSEFMTILRGTVALERLILHWSQPYGDVDLAVEATGRYGPVPLVKLTYLSLSSVSQACICGLLRTLYMPSLTSLTLNLPWEDCTELPAYITAPATVPTTLLSDERRRSVFHNLETLDIHLPRCPTDVIEVLYDELENVTSLKISMDCTWHDSSGCVFVLPLVPPDTAHQGSVRPRLPRLETLSISDVDSRPRLQAVRTAVEGRYLRGCPLGSVYLEGRYDEGEGGGGGEEEVALLERCVETLKFFRRCERERERDHLV